jgi:hypothetical protein
MWRRLGWLLLLLPQWAVAEDIRFSYGVEHFLWEEFDNSGQKLLDETGLRHVFALQAEKSFFSWWQSDLSGRVILGRVAYDGQNQAGAPVSTDTDYRGYGLELGITYFPGMLPSAASAGAGVRLALGIDDWNRTLLGAGGYNEHYTVTAGRVGAVYTVPARWRVELGARLPVAASERVDLSAYGYVDDATLNPKGQPSIYLTWHYQLNQRLDVSLKYDGYLFAKSDDDIIYNAFDSKYYAVHQPRSEMRTLGLAISLSL